MTLLGWIIVGLVLELLVGCFFGWLLARQSRGR